MERYLHAPGFKLSLSGALVFLAGILLLFVWQPLGAVVMIAGGLMVFSGLIWTLRTPSDVERRARLGHDRRY